MKVREVEHSRTFNLVQYESERIGLGVQQEETEDLDEMFEAIETRVLRLF